MVADVAVSAFDGLRCAWPGAATEDLRSVVVHGIYSRFAAAYGMREPGVDDILAAHADDGGASFRAALGALPYADLTPEHFGAAHESLSDLTSRGGLVAGKRARHSTVHFTPRSLTEPIILRTLEPLLRERGIIGDGRLPNFRIGAANIHAHDPDGPADAAAALLANLKRVPRVAEVLALRVCDPAVGAGAFPLALVRLLGPLVAAGFRAHGGAPEGADIDVLSKQLVAVHVVHAIDVCPFAVAACKLALRLECRADTLPLAWLDNNVKCGDLLLGIDPDRLVRFHWMDRDTKGREVQIIQEVADLVARAMAEGARLRREHILLDASADLGRAKAIADVLVGAFFAHDKSKAREEERLRRLPLVRAWIKAGGELTPELAEMRRAIAPRRPFHIYLEFPEVFGTERVGGMEMLEPA